MHYTICLWGVSRDFQQKLHNLHMRKVIRFQEFHNTWYRSTTHRCAVLSNIVSIVPDQMRTCRVCHSPFFVPWDADPSWKGINLIQSLSTKKTSKTYQNIHNFVWFKNYQYFGTFMTFYRYWAIGSNRFLFMSNQCLMAQFRVPSKGKSEQLENPLF